MNNSTDLIPALLPSFNTLEDLKGPQDQNPDAIFNIGQLYRMAIDNSNDEHMQRAGVLHPSSVGYCKRANFYQYMLVVPTDKRSKEFIEIVTLGHKVHDVVQGRLEVLKDIVESGHPKLYRHAKYHFVREVPYDKETDALYLDLRIGGTCDGLLTVSASSWSQRGVVEIKSQNNEWFIDRMAEATAQPEHLMQSHLYAFRFNAPIIWVWYYNKNTSKRELKPQFFDWKIFEQAVDYFAALNEYIDKRTLPPREDDWFQCKECVYRTKCDPPALRKKYKGAALTQVPVQQLQRRKKT